MANAINLSHNVVVLDNKIISIRFFGDSIGPLHQQFDNDVMLIRIPIVQDKETFKKILMDFMEAFGTSINHGKSQIFLFLNLSYHPI